MKNKIFLKIIIFLFYSNLLIAQDVLIEAKNITLDKDGKTSIFEKDCSHNVRSNIPCTVYQNKVSLRCS